MEKVNLIKEEVVMDNSNKNKTDNKNVKERIVLKFILLLLAVCAIYGSISYCVISELQKKYDALSYYFLNTQKYVENNNVDKYDEEIKKEFADLANLRLQAFEQSDLFTLKKVNNDFIDLEIAAYYETFIQPKAKDVLNEIENLKVENYNDIEKDREIFNSLKKDTEEYFNSFVVNDYDSIKDEILNTQQEDSLLICKVDSPVLNDSLLNEQNYSLLILYDDFLLHSKDKEDDLIKEKNLTTSYISARKQIDGLISPDGASSEGKAEVEALKKEAYTLINTRKSLDSINQKIADIENKIIEITPYVPSFGEGSGGTPSGSGGGGTGEEGQNTGPTCYIKWVTETVCYAWNEDGTCAGSSTVTKPVEVCE